VQSKRELEEWYQRADPWQYTTTADDVWRKNFYITALASNPSPPYTTQFERALDVGAGEGFITTSLPANEIHGIELSDAAAGRFPSNVTRVAEPKGEYDLVISTGTIYVQYDHAKIYEMIMNAACKTVAIGGIKNWLTLPYNFGNLVREFEFPYREFTSCLRIYEV
jgi:hypothetical protein